MYKPLPNVAFCSIWSLSWGLSYYFFGMIYNNFYRIEAMDVQRLVFTLYIHCKIRRMDTLARVPSLSKMFLSPYLTGIYFKSKEYVPVEQIVSFLSRFFCRSGLMHTKVNRQSQKLFPSEKEKKKTFQVYHFLLKLLWLRFYHGYDNKDCSNTVVTWTHLELNQLHC